MKKLILLAMVFIASLTSCHKEISEPTPPIQSGIVKTDNPPASLFSSTPYGNTRYCWIDSGSINQSRAQGQGDLCSWDNYSGTWYDCGLWQLMPVRKYWGIINGVIYLSESKDWYAISPNIFLKAYKIVQSRKTGIGELYAGYQNPIGTPFTIGHVQ
ncbi:MAG TPA: hypothetical protein VLB02_00435 [Candidatus Paceibacterota bacterium]|nr:hypothetical protein [Candidatus Paceibacterota bacterium]